MDLKKAQVYKNAYSWLVTLYENIGGITNHQGGVIALKGTLKRGGLSLSDIGTSEEDLEKLRVEACRREAKMYLGFFSSYDPKYENFAIYAWSLRSALKSGVLSLSDIGTSEEQLATLACVPTSKTHHR